MSSQLIEREDYSHIDIKLESCMEDKGSDLRAINIDDLKVELMAEIEQALYPITLENLDINKYIEIKQVASGDFNACTQVSVYPTILLSMDRIKQKDMKRVLIHELSHGLLMNFWQSRNLSQGLKTYYNEGLAVYLSCKLLGLDLYEGLNISREKYDYFQEHKNRLSVAFSDYINGNDHVLHNGKRHSYFVKKTLHHPFKVTRDVLSRYGYFLAAIETQKLIEEGNYGKKLLCQQIS